jgi:DnaJ domain
MQCVVAIDRTPVSRRAKNSVVPAVNTTPDRSGCLAGNRLQKRNIGSKIEITHWRHDGQSNASGDRRAMPYRRGPRDRPSRAIFWAGWLSLVVGLLTSFAAFVLSDDFEGPAIGTVMLVPAMALLLLEVRRRRTVWERWQSLQKRGYRPGEHARTNIPTGEPLEPWWQVLGISEQSTPDDLKAAYYAKIKQFHPDTVTGLAKEFQELAERKTKEINQAYRQASQSHRLRSPRESQENPTSG